MAKFGQCKVYLGAALAGLPQRGPCADVVMTDPPYRITSGGNMALKGMLGPDQYDNSGNLFDVIEWHDLAPLLFAACRADADCYVMSSDRELQPARAALEAAGFRFHRLLTWHKVTCPPNRWYMQDCEFCLYMWKGDARMINRCGSKALVRAPREYASKHPTEKPVSILRHWIGNSCHGATVVLDPCMGSGSTLVAATDLGVEAIGIEKDPKWFAVAVQRVQEAHRRHNGPPVAIVATPQGGFL
jgi:site-specific DNA-methyltransferase (adenine-specific)